MKRGITPQETETYEFLTRDLETVEMSLTGVLGAIFETEEEEENE